jgi:hypothetical protein
MWFSLHGLSTARQNLLKKRSQRGIILGIFEEVKGFHVYVMDNKKVVNTQHIKYIETLSHAQKLYLLIQFDSSVDDIVDNADLATGTADNYLVDGASHPQNPLHVDALS